MLNKWLEHNLHASLLSYRPKLFNIIRIFIVVVFYHLVFSKHCNSRLFNIDSAVKSSTAFTDILLWCLFYVKSWNPFCSEQCYESKGPSQLVMVHHICVSPADSFHMSYILYFHHAYGPDCSLSFHSLVSILCKVPHCFPNNF